MINGIQHISIGIPNTYEAWTWYRQNLGFDIPLIDDKDATERMLPLTNNRAEDRHIVFAINMQGGAATMLWQYTTRKPEAPQTDIKLGDLGIFAAKIKSKNIKRCYLKHKVQNVNIISDIQKDLLQNDTFFIKDPHNNIFQVVENKHVFKNTKNDNGGYIGAIIGVSDMEKSINFYSNVLGYDKIVYNQEGLFKDLQNLNGGQNTFKRVLLSHSEPPKGALAKLLGESQIELIQVTDRVPQKIYDNRIWGDIGFMHLAFEVSSIKTLKQEYKQAGVNFVVESDLHDYQKAESSFNIGETAGHFAYLKDPDETILALIETHKMPILNRFDWNLNLTKRPQQKQIPNWLLKILSLNRKSD